MNPIDSDSSYIINSMLLAANSVDAYKRSIVVALNNVNPAIIKIISIRVSPAHFCSRREYEVDTSFKPTAKLITTII